MLHPLAVTSLLPPEQHHPEFDHSVAATGMCLRCGSEHTLPVGCAREEARHLMTLLEHAGRIDLAADDAHADPHFSLEYLHGVARGQMFGVMVCRTPHGEYGTLRAFSAQYNRVWNAAGWVPPVLDVAAFDAVVDRDDADINAMGRTIRDLESRMSSEPDADERAVMQAQHAELIAARRERSRRSMHDIHALYRLRNFHGETASLFDVFPQGRGIPTGTGDCCAPKLLQYAALHNLTPLGLAEFYLGRESRSGKRQHGAFYPSCRDKCHPILGFMLCGLDAMTAPR